MADTPVTPAPSFISGILSRAKAILAEVEAKVIYLWKLVWSKIEALDAAVNAHVLNLGTLPALFVTGLAVLVALVLFPKVFGIADTLVKVVTFGAVNIDIVGIIVPLAVVAAAVVVVVDIIKKAGK